MRKIILFGLLAFSFIYAFSTYDPSAGVEDEFHQVVVQDPELTREPVQNPDSESKRSPASQDKQNAQTEYVQEYYAAPPMDEPYEDNTGSETMVEEYDPGPAVESEYDEGQPDDPEPVPE